MGEGMAPPNFGLGTNIVNLKKDLILTASDRSLLDRGLSFVPSPKQYSDTDFKIQKTGYIFGYRDTLARANRYRTGNFQKKPFTEKTGYVPPVSDPEISVSVAKLRTEFAQVANTKNHPNLTTSERQSIHKLRQNPDIVIKPADKGSATVIMDRQDYINEAERQLGNPDHYKKLDKIIWPENRRNYNEIILSLEDQNFLSTKQGDYLLAGRDSKNRIFYILPKIHKPQEKWFQPSMPPGRPIISDCSSESYHLSELIDYHLKPISNRHPSFIKSTEDFLNKLSEIQVDKDVILVTLDVESMYTNIDIEAGLRSVKNAFDRYPDPRRPTTEILKLLELSLKCNDFEFNDQIYQQIKGCAMGKRFSPNFASIFMAEWEHEVLGKCAKQPLLYLRYLDDIFILWQHSRDDLDLFITTLNQHDPNIKLQPTISFDSVDFLDVTVYKGPTLQTAGSLDFKVFFKPTDTHQLLHAKSFHPPHTFKGIIKSQIIRFHRNSSTLATLNQACSVLFKALVPRGYTKRLLRQIKSQTLRQLNSYNLDHGLESAPKRKYHNRPVTVSGRSSKCMKVRCKLDTYIPDKASFVGQQTRNVYYLVDSLNCDSENVVYLITCKKCLKQYVGETKNPLRLRANNHLSSIRSKLISPIAEHFSLPDHSVKDHFEIMPIEKTQILPTEEETKQKRLEREAYWIQTLQTLYPLGFNWEPGKGSKKEIIPFVFQYDQPSTQFASLLLKEYQNLVPKMATPLSQRPIVAYKRNKNLKDLLVKAKLPSVSDR